MKNILWENIVKNILLILFLIPAHSMIENSLYSFNIVNKSVAADLAALLTAVSIIAVIACFGNFAFSYEKTKKESFGSRLLAHITTGLLMFVIGLSLEMISVISKFLHGDIPIFNLSLILLYIASVLYDFWDLKRIEL